MAVIKNEVIEILSSDDSDEEDIIVPNPEGSYQSLISVNGEGEDHDPFLAEVDSASHINDYELREFKKHRVFGWELRIRNAYANSTKVQVLYIPQGSFRRVLKNRKNIAMKTRHSEDGIKCTLITSERKEGKEEMYISKG